MTTLDEVEPSQRPAFVIKIRDLMLANAGPTFLGSSIGMLPSGAQIKYPWLAVQGQDRVGYARDGVLQRGGINFREVGEWEPVTEIRLAAIYEWKRAQLTDAQQEQARAVLDNMERTLVAFWNLDGLVWNVLVEEMTTDFIPIEGSEFFASLLRCHVYETLAVEYYD